MTKSMELRGISAFRPLAHLFFDPLAATRKLTTDHGKFVSIKTPFSKLDRSIVHTADFVYAEQILKNYSVFQNGGIIIKGYRNSTHNHLRRGYFSANGREYDHYIKLFGPLFKKKLVEDVYPIISSVVAEQLDGWPSDEVINIIPHINLLMKHLASKGMFKDPDIVAGLHAANMVERHGRLSSASLESYCAANYGRPGFSRLHKQAQATYDAIIDWGKTREGFRPDSDVLSTIVNAPDENGRSASPHRIAGYGWTMLGASYDTSTSILSWLFVLLSTHPDAARKLHEEVRAYHRPSEADIKTIMNLPYLDAVIKEALRLVPPAPIQRRKASVDTEISGYQVAAGSQILISAWMINRDAALYPEPDRFDPDRWEGLSRSPYQWLTFSAGPRRCLGIWFALAFLKTIVASVMARWRPEIQDGADISMRVAVTVRPGQVIPLALRQPDGNFRASQIAGSVHKYLQFGSS